MAHAGARPGRRRASAQGRLVDAAGRPPRPRRRDARHVVGDRRRGGDGDRRHRARARVDSSKRATGAVDDRRADAEQTALALDAAPLAARRLGARRGRRGRPVARDRGRAPHLRRRRDRRRRRRDVAEQIRGRVTVPVTAA